MIGQVVGKYRIAEQIGEGGMGMVYRAEHVLLGSPAAVKLLLPRWTRNRQIVDRFFTEARAASSIRHVNIVEVFDSGLLPNGQAYIAMELLEGLSLGQLIEQQRALAPPLAAAIGGQILAALDAAHVCGVIHRDLKPDNIQLVHDASAPAQLRAKILDFGIAKLLLGDAGRRPATSGGVLLGTPTYMSPEQCRGQAVDSRSDLYAAGCIFFEMLTGKPPFDAETNQALVSLHLHYPPPLLRSLAPELPVELEQLIDRMLAKEPERRTPSAAWVLAHLERVVLDSIDTVRPVLAAPPPRRAPVSALPAAALPVLLPDAPPPLPPRPGREPWLAPPGPAYASGARAAESAAFVRPSASMAAGGGRGPRVPLIILGVALLIALAAIVFIAQSGELPPPPPPPTR